MSLRCVIVEDEVMICDLISDIAAVAGWTPRHCRSVADLEARLDPMPDLVFLDIGLQHSNAFDAIRLLAARQFRGTVQIVSGQDRSVMEDVYAHGFRNGLAMADPIRKPFTASDIRAALDGTKRTSATFGSSIPAVAARPAWRVWDDPRSGTAGHFDCIVAELPNASSLAQIARDLPPPAACRSYAKTWSVALPVTMRDALATAATGAAALTCLTGVFQEDDVFADIDHSRTVFARLRDLGMTVRIDGCGARTFAMAGHSPFGVDEMVVRDFLGGQACAGVAERKMRPIAEIAHRSNARLLAAGVSPGVADTTLVRSGFDLVQRGEGRFAAHRFEAARRAYQAEAWQRVPIGELAAFQRRA